LNEVKRNVLNQPDLIPAQSPIFAHEAKKVEQARLRNFVANALGRAGGMPLLRDLDHARGGRKPTGGGPGGPCFTVQVGPPRG
jgi:hypothetical protein